MDVMFTFSDKTTLFYHDIKVALKFSKNGEVKGKVYTGAPIEGIHENVLIELLGEKVRHKKIGKVIIESDHIKIEGGSI